MAGEELSRYFANADYQRRALNAALYEIFEPDELNLYDASTLAFDPLSNEKEALRSFQEIYNALASKRWTAFRSNRPGGADRWSPRQVFETIKREFGEFQWGGPINLLTFQKGGAELNLRLKSCLQTIRAIKEKNDYPHMVVSKFLHFYNPELFPIYDSGVIWCTVLDGCFRKDFTAFCGRGRNDDTEAFLVHYMGWASSLLSCMHREFMQVFVDWLNNQPETALSSRRFDAATLYARAFEYTVVGAAKEECPHLFQRPAHVLNEINTAFANRPKNSPVLKHAGRLLRASRFLAGRGAE